MNECHALTYEEETLVRRIARDIFYKYCSKNKGDSVSSEDLCHEGIIGLLEARSSFDVSRGTPWLSFASIRVRGAMIDMLRRQPLIRLPQDVHKKVRELLDVKQILLKQGQDVTSDLLAGELGWSLEEVYEIASLSPVLVHLDEGESHDEEEYNPGVLLRNNESGPEKRSLQAELAHLVNICLGKLDPRDRLVVVGRLLEELKLKDLASTLGCTMENIRILQKKATNQLKKCIENQGWPVDSVDDILD